jgi:hypothetical protein
MANVIKLNRRQMDYYRKTGSLDFRNQDFRAYNQPIRSSAAKIARPQLDEAKKRKLNTLERISAGVTSFETGDPVYDLVKRIKEGKFDLGKEIMGAIPLSELHGSTRDTLLGKYKRNVGKGLASAISGIDIGQSQRTKKTYKDVAKELGLKDKTGDKKWYKNIDATDILGFAGDVALDPLTYVGAGVAGKATKVATKSGAKALTKTGKEVLETLTKKYGQEAAEKSVAKLIERSPSMAAKFVDRGGIRFAGKTVASTGALEKLPGKVGKVAGQIGEHGFTKGTFKAGVKGIEKTKAGAPIVEGFRSAFVGTSDDATRRIMDKFVKSKTYESEAAISQFMNTSKQAVKAGKKQYGSVEKTMRVATNYLETGNKKGVAKEVASWIDDVVRPTTRKLYEVEKKAGLLERGVTPENYAVRFVTKNADEIVNPKRVVGARNLPLKMKTGHEQAATFATKFKDKAGKETFELNAKPIGKTDAGKKLTAQIKQVKKMIKDGKLTKEVGEKRIDDINKTLNTTFIDKQGKKWTATRATIDEANKYAIRTGRVPEGVDYFNTNLLETMTRRIDNSISTLRSQEFAQEMTEMFGVKLDAPKNVAAITKTGKAVSKRVAPTPPGYTTLKIPGFEGVAFPKNVADEIGKTHKIITGKNAEGIFKKYYDNGIKYWKISVTTPFQAFHLRNLQGGLFNNWLAGINPVRYPQYVPVRNYMRSYNKLLKQGLTPAQAAKKVKDPIIKLGGKNFKASELVEMANKNGVLGTTGMLDISMQRRIASDAGALKRGLDATVDFTGKEAREIESFLRMPVFMDGLAKGESPRMAMERVMKYHFDYNKEALTMFENDVMKRIIPFYTWTRNNIPLQLEQIGKQPGKYSAVSKAILGGDREQGFGDRDVASDYVANRTSFRLPNGKYVTIGLPMNDLTEMTSMREWAGKVSPLIKAPIEAVTGQDTFRERPIIDPDSPREEHWEQWRDWAIRAALGRSKTFGEDLETLLDEETTSEDKQRIIYKQIFGLNVTDINKYPTRNIKEMMLKNLPKEMQEAYKAAHVNYEDEYPLLASKRKATVYLDFPELFLVDQAIKATQKERNGKDYDPIYDLPWEQAKIMYAQQAEPDRWNSKEIAKLPWASDFYDRRGKYFDKKGEDKDSDFGFEAEEFANPQSAHVKRQIEAGNWDDPQVKKWREDGKRLRNERRDEIGLITPEPKDLIDGNIFAGKEALSAGGQKTLWYMQALRQAGIPGAYEKFFDENPHLDPRSPYFTGFAKTGSSGYGGYSKKAKTRKPKATNIKPYKEKPVKISKAKVIKLGKGIKAPNPKNVRQWTR